MEESGIVRRIDNLGRIVIPKEVRKSLRIKNGDLIEIIIKNNAVILQKNSTLKNFEAFGQELVEVVNDILGINIFVTDRDSFVVGSGELAHKLLQKNIGVYLEKIIMDRDYINEEVKKEILLTDKQKYNAYYNIQNIIVNGDCVGLVIFISEQRSLAEVDNKIINVISQFLSKYIED